MSNEKIGILAIQGDYALHKGVFEQLGKETVLVKKHDQLEEVDRLVIPGGESTTIQLLIDKYGLREPLIDFGRKNPVWGTCAGTILLAESVDDERIQPLKLIRIDVQRNAYGRQIDSFVDTGSVSIGNGNPEFEMVFIRAPKIRSVGEGADVLGRWNDEITVVRQNNVLVTTFHPELTDDPRLHEYFLTLKSVSS